MRKLILPLVAAVATVFVADAGVLQDYFDNSVRPVATMAVDAPAEELSQSGLTSASTAMISADEFRNLWNSANFDPSAALILSEDNDDGKVKVWRADEGDNSEVLMLIDGSGTTMSICASGPKAAVDKFLE